MRMIPVNSISKIPLDKKGLTVKNLKSGVIVFELARIKLPSITVSSVKTPSGLLSNSIYKYCLPQIH